MVLYQMFPMLAPEDNEGTDISARDLALQGWWGLAVTNHSSGMLVGEALSLEQWKERRQMVAQGSEQSDAASDRVSSRQ